MYWDGRRRRRDGAEKNKYKHFFQNSTLLGPNHDVLPNIQPQPMPPARSTPVISQDTSPLLAAARARSASSSKKKKVAATEKENVGAEPPAARRKRSGPTRQGAEDEQPTLSLEEIVNQLTAAQGV